MKKTQIKDVIRNIRANAVSWLAVVIVVTITCGVYCGVFFYADAMEDTAADFFEQTDFEDLTVMASLGLTEEEIRQLQTVPGVQDAEGTFRLSGVSLRVGQQTHTADVLAVTERVSVPELLDGRLPGPGFECALPADTMERFGLELGSTVELELYAGMPLSFTVTGVVRHADAYYQGKAVYVFVPAATFAQPYGEQRFPLVLLDASCGGTILSDEYAEDLSTARAGVMAEMEEMRGTEAGFVITARTEHESYMVMRQIVEILRKLSTIFVVVFVIIGGIVVMSTITVVIDGQKRQIGFLKAYGFRNIEIIRRYLVYSESAVLVGMLCTVGVAALLQIVLRDVLSDMFCLENGAFAFRLGSYFLLLLVEAVITAAITSWVTVSNASKYSAVELMSWNGKIPDHSRKQTSSEEAETVRRGTLYSRLIFRNIRSDQARVTASVIIIAGCCFMIGIGLTLNSAFHSMTKNTRTEVALYDLECAVLGNCNIGEVEAAVLGAGADCARATRAQTVYGFDGHEEYVNVLAAAADVYGEYIRLIDANGKRAPVPEAGCVRVQNRISERLGVTEGDEITLFDGALQAHTLRVSGTARNYIGRVVYLSEETFTSVFGTAPAANTLLVRLGGVDRGTLEALLAERFPDVEISYTDTMPGMYAGLTDAFNALIFVLITLSVIMSVFVLLNLVNIFVSRRKNELIIMGINGFSYREEIRYLLRETIATTGVGLVLGVLFGMLVTKPLVQVIESTDTMCARGINWIAWAVGMAMEAVFALVINLYAFRRVKEYGIKDLK